MGTDISSPNPPPSPAPSSSPPPSREAAASASRATMPPRANFAVVIVNKSRANSAQPISSIATNSRETSPTISEASTSSEEPSAQACSVPAQRTTQSNAVRTDRVGFDNYFGVTDKQRAGLGGGTATTSNGAGTHRKHQSSLNYKMSSTDKTASEIQSAIMAQHQSSTTDKDTPATVPTEGGFLQDAPLPERPLSTINMNQQAQPTYTTCAAVRDEEPLVTITPLEAMQPRTASNTANSSHQIFETPDPTPTPQESLLALGASDPMFSNSPRPFEHPQSPGTPLRSTASGNAVGPGKHTLTPSSTSAPLPPTKKPKHEPTNAELLAIVEEKTRKLLAKLAEPGPMDHIMEGNRMVATKANEVFLINMDLRQEIYTLKRDFKEFKSEVLKGLNRVKCQEDAVKLKEHLGLTVEDPEKAVEVLRKNVIAMAVAERSPEGDFWIDTDGTGNDLGPLRR